MDVNGTSFHLLLGEADWTASKLERTSYDTVHDELTLTPLPMAFPPQAGSVPLSQASRRGAARDRFGSWYWIDREPSQILVTSAGSGVTTSFWPTGSSGQNAFGGFGFVPTDSDPPRLNGIAVTDDGYLVAGCAQASALLVFDLVGDGAPSVLHWPAGLFDPWDLAARPGGGVVILDRAARRYWELDRTLRIITRAAAAPAAPDFSALDGSPVTGTRPVLAGPADAVALATDLAGADGDPIAVDCAQDGAVAVLFRTATGSIVRVYRNGFPVTPAVVLLAPDETAAAGGARPESPLIGHDLAVLGPQPTGNSVLAIVAVTDQSGNQAYEFALQATGPAPGEALQPLPRYLPMRRHGGRALVAAAGRFWYDSAVRSTVDSAGWVPLVEHPRRRYELCGEVTTVVLDGGEPGCVWHRLIFDARLAPGTAVTVESAASDLAGDLEEPAWQPEPAPYVRGYGTELPFTPMPAETTTLELAFQQARGRHLRLRLTLTGSGRGTPRIRALRAYFPRYSYLERYLPAVYRDDARSASFLDRWLANLEGIGTEIEGRIAAAQLLFDPRTAPSEALDWLAGWFGMALDPAWDQARRRLLLANAMTFFAWRGTMRGLRMALAMLEHEVDASIFTDPASRCAGRVRIVELFRTKQTPGVVLGDPTVDALAGPAPGGGWWSPGDGQQVLNDAWTRALTDGGIDPGTDPRFPVVTPVATDQLAIWSDFAPRALGLVPGLIDAQLWQDFLVRRYAGLAGLRSAYGTNGPAEVAALRPPQFLPDSDNELRDWYQVQSVVLRALTHAHRFRVLLPVPIGASAIATATGAERRAQLALAQRVLELEKPAHTVFDVRFYWDAFRVGEARLALDTLVDLGSRSPALLTPAVLNHAYLGENVLARTDPESRARFVDLGCR